MNRLGIQMLLWVALVFLLGSCSRSADEESSKIFFFEPPAEFVDRDQYFDDHHYVATLTPKGIETEEMIRFDQPYLNFSQSAWNPKSESLITWKKNYEGRDHLMIVRLPGLSVEPLARFPESGTSPLLALDTRRQRVLVANRHGNNLAGLRGGKLLPEFHFYDLEERSWSSGSFDEIGLITISYSEELDRFIGIGRRVGTASRSTQNGERDDGAYVMHFDPEGTLIETVATDLVDHLHSPVVLHGSSDSLGVNHPGIQSRVIDDRLVVLRYVDLGRTSSTKSYDWSYELYTVDPQTGSSSFVQSFR